MVSNGEGHDRRSARTLAAPVAKRHPQAGQERLSPQASLREVMGQFATGVTVLTAGNADAHGMTANAFSSVSLDPPMVMCCVARAARMHEVIISARFFAVSILSGEQAEVATYFADWRRPSGRAQFSGVDWERGYRTGAPLLSGALAWLECELVTVYDGGDHSIFLGEVLTSRRGTARDPLLFFGGGFSETGAQQTTARGSSAAAGRVA